MNFKTIVAWNTNKPYSVNGQRIAVGITEEDKVYFADADRNIFGVLKKKLPPGYAFDDDLITEYVLHKYGAGHYTDALFQDVKVLVDYALHFEE